MADFVNLSCDLNPTSYHLMSRREFRIMKNTVHSKTINNALRAACRRGKELGATPEVSVTLPCYQGERYVAEAVKSVVAQTFPNWELIVLDDGSFDRTGEIVRRIADPRIRYVYQENRGLAAARNRLLQLANGELIAFLDQDDYWEPARLAKQIAVFERHPETALVYADCYIVDSERKIEGRWSDRYHFHRGMVFDELLRVNFIALPTVLMRRSALQETGDFPSYKFAEEFAVFLKCAARHPFDYVAEPLASYRVHPGQFSKHYQVALAELIEIYGYWESNGIPANRLARCRAMAYFNAGKGAIYRDRDLPHARVFFRQSLAHRLLLRTAAFYVLSFLPSSGVRGLRTATSRFLRMPSYSEIAERGGRKTENM